jgi:peptidoglycan-associated lipoprotein
MRMTLLAAIAATALVAACSSSPDNSATGSGNASGSTTAGGTVSGAGIGAGGQIVPGTAADLQRNVGDRVFFATDQSAITAEGRKTLERQAEWLKRYPAVTVSIEGHCDERGLREYNLALGERRAAMARQILTALGVDPNRVKTVSYGKERPAVVGSDETAWAQNRRAVTVVD